MNTHLKIEKKDNTTEEYNGGRRESTNDRYRTATKERERANNVVDMGLQREEAREHE